MRRRCCLETLGWLLMAAVACGQTTQQGSDPQPNSSQPAKSQPTNSPTTNQKPIKPSAVAAAASASRQTRESAPPTKVIRNHDLNDGNKAAPEEDRTVQQFEAQGNTFKNQIKVQKGKIVDIQNQITSLKNQFAEWSAEFAQADEAQACWTSTYYTPYYKNWCDTGRNLKAQYEASQRQFAQEKARLEQMQENIRRAGYGNAVYDPD
jgi:hypothetical protein